MYWQLIKHEHEATVLPIVLVGCENCACIAGCRLPNLGIASAGSSNGLDLAQGARSKDTSGEGKLNLEKESRIALLKLTQIVSANELSHNYS